MKNSKNIIFLLSKKLTAVTQFLSLVWIIGFLFLNVSWGSQNKNRPVVNSELKGIDQAVNKLYVSSDFVVPKYFNGKLVTTNDLSLVEISAIEQFTNDYLKLKSTSVNSLKSVPEILLVRYTVGDDRMSRALLEAFKSGIKVELITDANPFAKVEFADDEKLTADFNRFKISTESEGGKFIHELLNNGFQWNENLFSQPVYNTKLLDRIPIMHEKGLILSSPELGSKMFLGTANLARNPRYNRIFEINDSTVIKLYQEHFNLLKSAYQNGLETKKATDSPWTKVIYKDGTWLELAYTDGRYNPNERMLTVLQNNKIKNILLSHFVLTHRGFMQELEKALRADPDFKVQFVGDDRFASLDEWGLSPAFIGVNIYSPFNRNFVAFEKDLWPRIEGVVYQRPAIDPITGEVRTESTEEGPPTARHVWHDKTSIFELNDGAYIYSGSFNLSNNDSNAEVQMEMKLNSKSWILNATKYSVTETVKKDKKFAVPLMYATLRNAIGLVFGLTDLEIPITSVVKLHQLALKGDRDKFFIELRKLSTIQGQLSKTVSKEERISRVGRFSMFLNWFLKNARQPTQTMQDIIPKMVSIAILIAKPNSPVLKKADIIGGLISTSGQNSKWVQQKIEEAFQVLGFGRFNPYQSAEVIIVDEQTVIDEILVSALELNRSINKKHFIFSEKDPNQVLEKFKELQKTTLNRFNKEILVPESEDIFPRDSSNDMTNLFMDLKNKGVTKIRLYSEDKNLQSSVAQILKTLGMNIKVND